MANLDNEHYDKLDRMKDLNTEELLDAVISALETDKAQEIIDWIWNNWEMEGEE